MIQRQDLDLEEASLVVDILFQPFIKVKRLARELRGVDLVKHSVDLAVGL